MKKQLTGIVKGDKMIGTASVIVTRFKVHPLYLKRTKWTKSYLADNSQKAKTGDTVVIESTRPLSKRKAWKIIKIKSSTTPTPSVIPSVAEGSPSTPTKSVKTKKIK